MCIQIIKDQLKDSNIQHIKTGNKIAQDREKFKHLTSNRLKVGFVLNDNLSRKQFYILSPTCIATCKHYINRVGGIILIISCRQPKRVYFISQPPPRSIYFQNMLPHRRTEIVFDN